MQARLGAYLERLGLEQAPAADPEGLAVLQHAHRQAITFENCDIILGRTIRIGSEEAFAKLVTARRGGYCFEQNRLYSDMLAALGIENRPLLARVRLGQVEGIVPVRSHFLLLARLGGYNWIADAGFGGSYVPPMRLVDGEEVATPDGARHRLRHVGLPDGEWLLERAGPREATDGRALPHDEWQAQYTFDLSAVAQSDLEQANHWTATHPASRFVAAPLVTIALPNGFASLSGNQLSVSESGVASRREIADAQDWRSTVREIFGLEFTPREVAAMKLFAP